MLSRRRAMGTLAAAALGAACRGASEPTRQWHPSLDDFAERYVRLTLRLARHQPSLVETWLGPEAWRPAVRDPVEAIRKDIVDAHAAMGLRGQEEHVDTRHAYLEGQFQALAIAARRLGGESMRFLAEASAALGVGPEALAAKPAEIARAREDLERVIPGKDPLPQRYAAFRSRHAIPPKRVLQAFQAAINECRSRVSLRFILPGAEAVEVGIERGLGLAARAVYSGDFRTRVTIDDSGPMDVAQLVWLAAHETYPGHHLQHVLADRDCVRARGWLERELVPVFGRHHLYGEGAAEAGAALLLDGDVFAEICRAVAQAADVKPDVVPDLVAVHRAVVALDALIPGLAQAYLDGEIGSEAAVERLTGEALVANGTGFLLAIEHQRTRMLAYPVGRRLVAAALAAVPPDARWRRFSEISTTLCLNNS